MRRPLSLIVLVGLVLGFVPGAASAATPTLVRIIRTSEWSPPSPDPMGITYDASNGRLIVVDSEVEEIPTLFTGVNVFEATTTGTLQDTDTTTAFTPEPTDIAIDPVTGHVFITDDDKEKIFDVDLGTDGELGTNDDSVTSFGTVAFGSGDPEGLSYGANSLWIADGTGTEVYRLQRGSNGRFDGVAPGGDDIATHWDTSGMGQQDPEGVEYNSDAGTIFVSSRANDFVVEATQSGGLVRSLDLREINPKNPAGLAYAPTSNDATSRSLYIADRGVDNDSVPDENDGRIFEVSLGAPATTNTPPNVTDPGDQTNEEGDAVTLAIEASDGDGDDLTYSANGLPSGLSISTASGTITGTIANGAAADSPYSVTVSASDGIAADQETFSWTVTAPPVTDAPPASPSNLTTRVETDRIYVDWRANREADLAGYNVYRSASQDGTFTKLTSSLRTSSNYTDKTAPPGEVSYYRVTAVDTAGNESDPSSISARRGSISYVAARTSRKVGSTLTISKPTGIRAGDVMLASIAVRGSPAVTPPSGWTPLVNTAEGTTVRQVTFYRLAGSSEPSSYKWSFGVSRASVGTIVAYRGIAVPPIATSAGIANASSSSIRAPSVTSPTPNAALVGFFGIANGATIAPPTGMMERAEKAETSTTSKVAIEASDDFLPEAGATGERMASASAAAVNIGHVVALNPLL